MTLHKFASFSPTVIGYRSFNPPISPGRYGGIQYFAAKKSYSQRFGTQTIEKNISLAKACFLEDWNNLLRAAGYNDFGGQGLLTISRDYLQPAGRYFEYGDLQGEIYHRLGGRQLAKFLQELRTADVIVGEDAGHPGEIVYAVRHPQALS